MSACRQRRWREGLPIVGGVTVIDVGPDGSRSPAQHRGRAVAGDVLLALVLASYGFAAGLASDEYPAPGPVTAALVGSAGLALIVRRTHPLIALVTSTGLLAAAGLLYGSYQAGSSLLIGLVAFYSAAAYAVPLGLVAGAALALALAESSGPFPDSLGSAVFVLAVLAVAAAGGWLARRMRALSAANAALRELVQLEAAATTRTAVEEERARVARELHDILSHSLGVVVLQTSAAEHAWEADPDGARQSIHLARQTATEAVGQLRTLLQVIREDDPQDRAPVPTLADLDALAARSTSGGFRVDLVVLGEPRPVAAAVQASVFRIAQEGLANAMKHSGATRCTLQLTYEPAGLTVEVRDDGTGAPDGHGSQSGLAGIRERAALFGGVVRAGPGDAGGWAVRAELPT